MDAPENMDKAAWTKEMLHVFCDLSIKAIDMGMRPNTHFDKAGWKYLLGSFKEQTGTISASDEWWKSKIQEIRGAKKFRHAGIEPLLCMKFDRMFANIVATSEYAWVPLSGVLLDHNVGVDGSQHTHVEQPDLEEGSGDSEEDGIPNFADDVCNMVRGVNMDTSSNNRSSGKRKERQRVEVQAGKKKRNSGIGFQLLSRWDHMVDSMSNTSDSASISKDREGCSICEVMTELHSHEGVHIGDDFHGFATEILGAPNRGSKTGAPSDIAEPDEAATGQAKVETGAPVDGEEGSISIVEAAPMNHHQTPPLRPSAIQRRRAGGSSLLSTVWITNVAHNLALRLLLRSLSPENFPPGSRC
ncbi:L10-interacting MYB domain-containing protein-like isoform X2 [Populus alba x Populus x berolinensis]|uniref:L10-interacting MYB domain-containing protein-like isoform X2 n=1 Tax=Populus alba x Populus x berolinensis TaxID=444605 RepID=A0AAD6PQI8_9ROSI|nr:L10-interacting MYB domain-containing protein-like isoform X2 [Populus alba x Populus x berolinensis]